MSNILINNYNEIQTKAKQILIILESIPYQYINDEVEYGFINRIKKIISQFLQLNIITEQDLKKINEIIDTINIENLFEYYLSDHEKKLCNNELSKYLVDPINYVIPNLEFYIDNGEFLKMYIQHLIDKNIIINKKHSKQIRKIKQKNK